MNLPDESRYLEEEDDFVAPPQKDPHRSISVVMPSFLGKYKGCASARADKFLRAVRSYISQSFDGDKELIIVSDGCADTKRIYESFFSKHDDIRLIKIPKQTLFSGAVRDRGLKEAKHHLVCYLDTDDYFTVSHLSVLVEQMLRMEKDWVFYSDWIRPNKRDTLLREVSLVKGSAGTSSICHKRELDVSWKDLDGYGHDWLFIEQLKKASSHYAKIHGCGYVVCHTGDGLIDY